jgi:hypothetical protein
LRGFRPAAARDKPADVNLQCGKGTVAAGGALTAWRVGLFGATPAAGEPITLVVLRPLGDSSWTIAATDPHTIPTSIPADGILRFTPLAPTSVEPGDTIGILAPPDVPCYWSDGSTPTSNRLGADLTGPALTVGQSVTALFESPDGYQLNLAADLTSDADVRMTGATTTNAIVNTPTAVSATVVNGGQGAGSFNVSASLPPGLQVTGAVASGGSCTTQGQQVSCAIPRLDAGASAPVVVLVTPTVVGAQATTFTAQPAAGQDVNPADNSATTTLNVANPPTVTVIDGLPPGPKCIVPTLKGATSSLARSILRQLRCKPARSTSRHAKAKKGTVLGTRPGAGTYLDGKSVQLVVSSGPARARRARSHRASKKSHARGRRDAPRHARGSVAAS